MKKEFTFVGWIIFLLMLYLISKTKAGYNMIYYVLVLTLVLLLVGNYKAIEAITLKEEK